MSEGGANFVIPFILHLDTSGMAPVTGIIERFQK